jgi:6,7-dimethyl-8-ribityllumazine synthase
MSNIVPPRPRFVGGKRSFTIVASKFNEEFVQGLVNHTTEKLREISASATIVLHQVPGAFEIPIVVRELALQKKTDVIIAIGVILKGRTAHAEHLARSVTDALQRIAIDHGVPVINVVLSMENELQARERCLDDKINRGTEAARAAFEIANVIQEVRGK